MKRFALALVAAVALLAAVPASAQTDRAMRADGMTTSGQLLNSNAQMMRERRMRRSSMSDRRMRRGPMMMNRGQSMRRGPMMRRDRPMMSRGMRRGTRMY